MDHYRDSFYTKPYVIKKKQNVVLIPEPCVNNNATTPFCLKYMIRLRLYIPFALLVKKELHIKRP